MKAAALAGVLVLVASASVHAGEMKGMDVERKSMQAGKGQTTHKAVGVVKKTDPKAGTVTFAHEPVPSMKWPSMTMAFQVKDKALFDKLGEGKKVEFEFQQHGKDYVVTSAK